MIQPTPIRSGDLAFKLLLMEERLPVLAQRAPGAACPTCGQSGPSKPGSKPCRHCGRNTVHQ